MNTLYCSIEVDDSGPLIDDNPFLDFPFKSSYTPINLINHTYYA